MNEFVALCASLLYFFLLGTPSSVQAKVLGDARPPGCSHPSGQGLEWSMSASCTPQQPLHRQRPHATVLTAPQRGALLSDPQ